mgnify:CR=1 FL=1
MNIIGVEWRTGRTTIGIVAVEDEFGWNAYMASVPGNDEEADAQLAAGYGCYLIEPEGRAFFPQFSHKPYKNK